MKYDNAEEVLGLRRELSNLLQCLRDIAGPVEELEAVNADLLEALQYGIDMTKPADNGEYPYRTRHTVENMHRTFMQAIARATPERKQEI